MAAWETYMAAWMPKDTCWVAHNHPKHTVSCRQLNQLPGGVYVLLSCGYGFPREPGQAGWQACAQAHAANAAAGKLQAACRRVLTRTWYVAQAQCAAEQLIRAVVIAQSAERARGCGATRWTVRKSVEQRTNARAT